MGSALHHETTVHLYNLTSNNFLNYEEFYISLGPYVDHLHAVYIVIIVLAINCNTFDIVGPFETSFNLVISYHLAKYTLNSNNDKTNNDVKGSHV